MPTTVEVNARPGCVTDSRAAADQWDTLKAALNHVHHTMNDSLVAPGDGSTA